MAPIIDQPDYFTTLPREYYFSQDIFELETGRIFTRQWHYAGHTSEISTVGSYFLVELAGESVIVSRGEDGRVHALLNVCRHRGHPVCANQRGQVKRFICPYHRWSYRLDGSLARAPSVDDGDYIDYADWGLHRVQVDVWNGFIFICLAPDQRSMLSPDLDQVAGDMLPLETERMRKAHEVSYDVRANWKTLLENFQECYHCKTGHPELCVSMDLGETYVLSARPVTEVYGGGIAPRSGMATISMDGQPVVRPLLGEFGRGREIPPAFHAGFAIQPLLTRALFNVDHGTVHTIRPVDPTHVRFISRWFVHEDAVEGVDYDLEELTRVWLATNEQDIGLVTEAFRGVRSRRFVPGPLSKDREPGIRSSLLMYLRLMEGDVTGS